jgi:lipopolysaccharide transport system ATP-binding protein
VNFEVRQGETLGIVGRNGAGKSTLLKILSRITKPTGGEATVYGRVGSLLEVGTGFHQELSGRENLFLSGAILGMKRREIERKFDEIVGFAELEKIIDTPVKHYSSGMFMRLAFSVAVHLEPEILIVDEVLAVGDSEFQNKSLDKMHEIMNEGRTILFVSHNMSAVTRLCSRAIALNQGEIVCEGAAQKVVNGYLNSGWGISAEKNWEDDPAPSPQNEVVRLKSVRVIDESGATVGNVDIENPVGLEIVYEVLENGHVLIPNFHVFNQERLCLFAVQDVATEWKKRPREKGTYTTTAWIGGNFFMEGRVIVEVAVSSHIPESRVHLRTQEVVGFEVVEYGKSNPTRGDFGGTMPGVVRPQAKWETDLAVKK